MKLITDLEVETILLEAPHEYINYIHRRVGQLIDDGSVWLKDKIIYPDPTSKYGDVRPMTCFTNYVKIVKVISTNPHRVRHPSVSVGATLLLDYEENFPTHVFEATAMSGIRTAAMALWAISQIPYITNTILIVGKGRVGNYIKDLLEDTTTYEHISMLDTDSKTAKKMTYDSDIVITATDSKEPFITLENCTAKYVISVGADTHFNRELSHDFLQDKKIYTDIREACQVGDLEELKNINYCGDMFDLAKAPEEEYPDVFISVGSALMDALTIEYLVKNGA